MASPKRKRRCWVASPEVEREMLGDKSKARRGDVARASMPEARMQAGKPKALKGELGWLVSTPERKCWMAAAPERLV